MAPNVTTVPAAVLHEEDLSKITVQKPKIKNVIIWRNVVAFTILHIGALYGAYLFFTAASWLTMIYTYFLYVITGLGITAGVHRLWSHRAYKANLPLRIILMIFNTMAFQNSIYDWSRDHRSHHKYNETEADPHNSHRGFFFAHMGWLLCKKRPDVKEKGRGIDMNDLLADPVVAFQHKYYMYLMPIFCFILPSIPPVVLWNETFANSYFVTVLFRFTWVLHMTWLVNSAAHFFGGKPYDKHMDPAENKLVAVGALGEGWHNYHHVFPWDYKAAELGNYRWNFTTAFIDAFARIGWAYDLKTASPDTVKQRVHRTGDGTHNIWGWGDEDQTSDEKEAAVVLNHAKCQ